MSDTDRAWIEISRGNLAHNLSELQRLSGPKSALMPAVKANAYGHGDILTAGILYGAGIRDFCVATVDEAIRLRKAGISGQILILGYTAPDRFRELMHYELTQTAVDFSYAGMISGYCIKADAGKKIRVHVGVDTGMHRLGIPYDRPELIREIWGLRGLDVTGIFSHLCVSDGTTEAEERYTNGQMSRFRRVTEYLHMSGIRGFQTHIQGSYGLLNYPGYSCGLARPGIALYGCLSSQNDQVKADADLRPVLSLKARIASVKELKAGESAGYGLTYTAGTDRKIAIVTAGYADGIPRSLSNCGTALVRGRKVPVIGRVCMDQLTLDVTETPGAEPGDEVVFIGRSRTDDGKACDTAVLTAEDMAQTAGTITNEILSRLGARLKRIEME